MLIKIKQGKPGLVNGGMLHSDIGPSKASELVIEEAARGDRDAAQKRLAALNDLELIPVTEEMQIFAQDLMIAGAIPPSEPGDALHIALVTISGADYLVSWNFAHLVGPDTKIKLLDTIRALGERWFGRSMIDYVLAELAR